MASTKSIKLFISKLTETARTLAQQQLGERSGGVDLSRAVDAASHEVFDARQFDHLLIDL
jgi:hypothetical protein